MRLLRFLFTPFRLLIRGVRWLFSDRLKVEYVEVGDSWYTDCVYAGAVLLSNGIWYVAHNRRNNGYVLVPEAPAEITELVVRAVEHAKFGAQNSFDDEDGGDDGGEGEEDEPEVLDGKEEPKPEPPRPSKELN